MHTIFTILKNIVEMTKKWTEVTCKPTFTIGCSTVCVSRNYKLDLWGRKQCNSQKPKNVRKFTCDGKKEFVFCTCGGSENTSPQKTTMIISKFGDPYPFLPFCGRHKEIPVYLEILSWARNHHFKDKRFLIGERVSLKQNCS